MNHLWSHTLNVIICFTVTPVAVILKDGDSLEQWHYSKEDRFVHGPIQLKCFLLPFFVYFAGVIYRWTKEDVELLSNSTTNM